MLLCKDGEELKLISLTLSPWAFGEHSPSIEDQSLTFNSHVSELNILQAQW